MLNTFTYTKEIEEGAVEITCKYYENEVDDDGNKVEPYIEVTVIFIPTDSVTRSGPRPMYVQTFDVEDIYKDSLISELVEMPINPWIEEATKELTGTEIFAIELCELVEMISNLAIYRNEAKYA